MFEHDSMAGLDIPHSIINLSEDNECKPNFINFQNSTVQEQWKWWLRFEPQFSAQKLRQLVTNAYIKSNKICTLDVKMVTASIIFSSK